LPKTFLHPVLQSGIQTVHRPPSPRANWSSNISATGIQNRQTKTKTPHLKVHKFGDFFKEVRKSIFSASNIAVQYKFFKNHRFKHFRSFENKKMDNKRFFPLSYFYLLFLQKYLKKFATKPLILLIRGICLSYSACCFYGFRAPELLGFQDICPRPDPCPDCAMMGPLRYPWFKHKK
jgi:hypothetical protein